MIISVIHMIAKLYSEIVETLKSFGLDDVKMDNALDEKFVSGKMLEKIFIDDKRTGRGQCGDHRQITVHVDASNALIVNTPEQTKSWTTEETSRHYFLEDNDVLCFSTRGECIVVGTHHKFQCIALDDDEIAERIIQPFYPNEDPIELFYIITNKRIVEINIDEHRILSLKRMELLESGLLPMLEDVELALEDDANPKLSKKLKNWKKLLFGESNQRKLIHDIWFRCEF